MDFEEEPPPKEWGLDPFFFMFAKLYIKDILELKPSKLGRKIHFYKSHPVTKVEILGVVVFKQEREKFTCYGVDDGTGVVKCFCWKNSRQNKASGSGQSVGGLLMARQQQELQERSTLELGDLIRARGRVKTYREQMEVSAYSYCKVDDPTLEVQISWMREVPRLYQKYYDKPCLGSSAGKRPGYTGADGPLTLSKLVALMAEQLREFLRESRVSTFCLRDLETVDSLVSVACRPLESAPTEEEAEIAASNAKRVRHVFTHAAQKLEEEGLAFVKKCYPVKVYQVTVKDQDLLRVTRQIILADCKLPRNADQGCHFLDVFRSVTERFRSVNKAALRQVLDALELSSDIVSSTGSHYVAF
ncbi:CST complex subunit STN1-like [Acipenser oxyrinchus oxyrinchus]|uniref:CST complex subunit STN1 n=1 Tax=Acipenser oxyrinchus oxyrinchus TaxID=40147 RepID=A0AAD8CGQ8_ACIOX|nr:CST complex subunit STN1-like [Acipenser oxyrinchus oxyrinchus]